MSEIINELKALEVKYGITYKNVRLGDLFEIHTSPSINKGALVSARKGPYEFIGRTKQNYGVQQYIQKQNWEPNPENTFSISQIGSIHMQWRANKWYSSQNMFLLIPKVLDFSKSFNYITACVNKQFTGSGYQNYPTLKSLHVLVISLPHEPDGTLSIGFMEEFIATLERKRLATLDAYLSVKGWTTEDLGEKSKIQNQLTNLLENREIKWKDVKMSELFEIVNHTTIDKSSFKNNSTSTIGKYPYRTRTILNNGIEGYTDKELEYAKIEGKCIFVGMLGRKFFYEPNTFYAGQFTKSIYPKFEGFNKSVALYFIANFNKYHDAHVGLAVRYFNTTFYTHEISLPHTPEGDLDLEFMEDFIELIEKLKIHNVANELQTRINLTESIISNPN